MPKTVAEQLEPHLIDLQKQTECMVRYWAIGSVEPMYANVKIELKWADTSLSLYVGMNVTPLLDYLKELGWQQVSEDRKEDVTDQSIYMMEINYYFQKPAVEGA